LTRRFGVFYAETAAEKPAPVLTFVSYAMHPDTTGGTRSRRLSGRVIAGLALYKGPEMLTLLESTCGNINHIDVRWAGAQSGPHEAARLGTILPPPYSRPTRAAATYRRRPSKCGVKP
jgi:hypothetical protein